MDTKKRNRFWQLHSLLGIVLGLPLFIIFVAGTLAFFEPQAINWTQPRFQLPEQPQVALNPAISNLIEQYPKTDELSVVPASADHPVIDVYLEQNHEPTHYWLDPASLEATPATPHEADLFHFFVDLHYFDFIPFGREITGLIAALFFAIILTGIIYQWRSIRTDAKPQNLSLNHKNRWKNIHRFTSLFTLPFQALYAVTGAALALGLLLAAPAIYLFFDGKQEALNQALFPAYAITAPPMPGQAAFPVDEAISIARRRWPSDVQVNYVQIHDLAATQKTPASKTIVIQGKPQGVHFIGNHVLTLNDNLEILHEQSPTSHLASMLIESIVNLHFASFHLLAVKIVFVAVGLIVSLSIAAGILIFLRRYQGSSKRPRTTKCLTVLTDWMLGGLPLAIAVSLHISLFLTPHAVSSFATVMVLSFIVTGFLRNTLPILATASALAFLLLPVSFTVVQRQSPIQMGSTHAAMITLFHGFFLLTAAGIFWLKVKLSKQPDCN